MGYRGIINREKIAADAQKLSFLAGVFFRYGGFFKNTDGNYSVIIPNSLSTAKEYMDILNEFGCKVKKIPEEHKIIFSVSDKIANLTHLLYGLFIKTSAGIIAF
jgi:DNA-binding transcriptional regulator WhiA